METLQEKAEKLFRRVGPLKVTDEEIMRLAGVSEKDAKIIRVILEVRSFNLDYETLP